MMVATPVALAKTHFSEVRLTVRAYDMSICRTTREITSNVKRVLGQAGVPSAFLECYYGGVQAGVPACTGPLGSTDLILRIFKPELSVKGGQFGFAAMTPEGGAYMTVFLYPAKRKTRVGTLSDGSFLGHAVAHEIGHLLLGANSHSSSG